MREQLSDMDEAGSLLDAIHQSEANAIKQRIQAASIPFGVGKGIISSIGSIHTSPGIMHNNDNWDDNLPYDLADPNRNIEDGDNESSEDDIEINPRTGYKRELSSNEVPGKKRNKKEETDPDIWNTVLHKMKSGRQLTDIPEADYTDYRTSASSFRNINGDSVDGKATLNVFSETNSDNSTKVPNRASSRIRNNRKAESEANVSRSPGLKSKELNKNHEVAGDIEMTAFSSQRRQMNSDAGVLDRAKSNNKRVSAHNNDTLYVSDLAKLEDLTLDTLCDCLERRYQHDLIYTRCGEVLISINPFNPLEICSYKYFQSYSKNSIAETPHLFAVSAKAYKSARELQQNQVILVSGESGAGKTEATKLLVRHLMYIAGTEYETLQDQINKINPLLEAFGNAKTKLNNNSSRFTKLITLNLNTHGKIESARVKDYMLEKSRVTHHSPRERTFHAFYALLVGASDNVLKSLHIKHGNKFRVTGELAYLSGREKELYQTFYDLQQEAFRLIKLTKDEINDVHTILAAILHLGDIEFQESADESVVIKDEKIVHRVSTLLELDAKRLTKALIVRTARLGKDQKTLYEIKLTHPKATQDSELLKTASRGKLLDIEISRSRNHAIDDTDSLTTDEIIELSRDKKQAEDERDAIAESLYERLFGWLVRKINDSLQAFKNPANIGILDICGFENLDVNTFEQLCVNLVNEKFQNFMNKRLLVEKKMYYRQEGVEIGILDLEGINNDALLSMFLERESGILAIIDEYSKLETSTNEMLVSKLATKFGNSGIFVPSVTSAPEFRIRHFAGEVVYDARSFIQNNRDTLSETMKQCFWGSKSTLIQDLFSIQKLDNGSISMSNYSFRDSSQRSSFMFQTPSQGHNLSESINKSRKAIFHQKYGHKNPAFQNGDFTQRNTHVKFFRNSLDELHDAMSGAHPHYVRCLKPNEKQIPGGFSREKVKAQIKYNGIKEIARIHSFGFPIKLSKDSFKRKYQDLLNPNSNSDIFNNILQNARADASQYKIGLTQIFLTENVKADLDSALMGKTKNTILEIKSSQLIRELESATSRPQDNHFEPTIEPASDDSIYNRLASSAGTNNTQKGVESDESSDESSFKNVDEEQKEEVPPAAWDMTQELTEEEERHDVHEQPVLMGIKLIVYILLFVVVLVSFVTQKVCFLLLTTGLKVQISESDIKANIKKNVSTTLQIRKDVQTVFFLLLVIAICIPYALSWVITAAKLCFGNFKRPSLWTWVWVLVMESLHSVGLCLLVFRILPNLDVFRSTMLLSATAILPAFLKVTMSSSEDAANGGHCVQCRSNGVGPRIMGCFIDFIVLMAQISVIPLIIYMEYFKNEEHGYRLLSEPWHIAEIVGTFVLVSFSHWENFTDGRLFCELGQNNWFKNAVLKIRFELQNGRHFPHMIAYLWKIGLTLLLGYLLNEDVGFDYSTAMASLSRRKNPIGPQAVTAAIVLIISACIAFYVSFMACIFQMQVVSLAIPALLAVPVTFGIFYLNSELKFLNFLESDTEMEVGFFNNHLAFPGYSHNFLFGLAWWLSFVILNRHMWFPKVDRVANMARLFINQTYCGLMTYESVMLNRIRNPSKVREIPKESMGGEIKIMNFELEGTGNDKKDETKKPLDDNNEDSDSPVIPMLYACATMWHETRTEMIQILKSLHRLDRDQYIRAFANENIEGHDPELYNFEAHIFFDDAFEPDDDDISVPNKWVKELVSCMEVACSSVHGKPIKVHPPVKVPTPYGGQLIWQMPGDNLLFVHIKDIKKIRNRKRWSQVMYMYYLLGYRHIMASKNEVLDKMKKLNAQKGNQGFNINEINFHLGWKAATKARNTFLLALDGDTDFSPGAIKILLDRMKDDTVGAACGRIHPIGNGPLVWYQKFEYAIGHWLQKAAEHVFGCVLCSPGCFSLFRASALMDTNVMKRYTTTPTQPGHLLQFDQGEDRWLCTLLLQQGYRIEYAAAADAWTFAPEGFFEFFNQRRRWMPSTIANLLDLLGSATLTAKRNANISRLYIVYQWLLMLMTVLGPGTIIMMIAGAAKLVFKFSLVEAYIFSTVPAAIYIIICFWFRQRIQLIAAAILSVLYTFIMMVVFVGTVITATTENVLHPSVIVITLLISIFIISGLCHPQEVWCLMHGVLYLLTIPTGYLLLVIYSICNLNDVSWGTREVPTKAERLEIERKKKLKEEENKNKPKRGFLARVFNSGEERIRELTKLMKTLVPQRNASSQERMIHAAEAAYVSEGQTNLKMVELLAKIERNLEQLLRKNKGSDPDLDPLTSIIVEQPQSFQQDPPSVVISPAPAVSQRGNKITPEEVTAAPEEPTDGKKKKRKRPRNELRNPLWSEDPGLGSGKVIVGNEVEMKFWADFIEKYLKPIRPTDKEKKDIADGLRDLRNSSTFALIIINLLWMALNFMFQLTNAARFTIIYGPNGSYKIEESVLGMGFVFLLLLLLIIQLFGMFIHRMGTLQQLLAITEIKICKPQDGSTSKDQTDRDAIIQHVKEVLKIQATSDAGAETLPPVIAQKSQMKLGVTVVKPSNKDIFGQDFSGKTVMKAIGETIMNPMYKSGRSGYLDAKIQDNAVHMLMQGSMKQNLSDNEETGKSIRPPLPPRIKAHTDKWGFTHRELQNENLLKDIEEPNLLRRVGTMGAMGRSLIQRSNAIEIARRHSNLINDTLLLSRKKNSVADDIPLDNESL